MPKAPKVTETTRAGIVCADSGCAKMRTWRAFVTGNTAKHSPRYRYVQSATRAGAIRRIERLTGNTVISIYREG